MPLACPVCRAMNDRGPGCRRCRADLSLCLAVERQRDQELGIARRSALAGQIAAARHALARAAKLRRGDDLRRWAALLELLDGRYAAAWNHLRNVSGITP